MNKIKTFCMWIPLSMLVTPPVYTPASVHFMFCISLFPGICGLQRGTRRSAYRPQHVKHYPSRESLALDYQQHSMSIHKLQLHLCTAFLNLQVKASFRSCFLPPPRVLNQVVNLRARGMEFLSAPDLYYDTLRKNLKTAKIKVKEDLDRLQVRRRIISVSLKLFTVFLLVF